jgi:hypothetical protein
MKQVDYSHSEWESFDTQRRFHLCINIEGALKQRSIKIFEDDEGRILSTKAAKEMLEEEKAKGHKYFCGCDNRDTEGRCLGHEQHEA